MLFRCFANLQRASRCGSFARWPAFHSSAVAPAKLFMDKENKHAHEVLEQSLKSYKLFRLQTENNVANATSALLPPAVLNAPTQSTNVAEIFAQFCALTDYCASSNNCISDACFTSFVQHFCNVCHALSDQQLLQALQQLAHLPVVESVKVPNYMELWNALDAECCCRVDNWSIDQLLLVSDAWFVLNLARICDFLPEALRKLGRKVLRMQPEQLVQCMFYCNVLRRSVYDMFDFEVNLLRCASQMSLDELAVMSMGFFKTQSPIQNAQLLQHLYERLQAELDSVKDITLVAILKILRYSSRLNSVHLLNKLLTALCEQVERISLLSCLHAALLGTDLQCCNDELMLRILQRFSHEIDNMRLKDLERICFAISVLNYRSESGIEEKVCADILQSLNTRFDEIIQYPRVFSNCLHFLSLRGYYDMEMISAVLDKSFLQHSFGKNTLLGREIFQLDSFVKINLLHKGYEGAQLDQKQRRLMGKLLTHYIPDRRFKLTTTDRILLEIKETMDRIFRPNVFKHLLPHFERADIVFAYDKRERRAVPLSTACEEDYRGVILTRAQLLGDLQHSADIETVAIVVVGWNNMVRDKNRFTGLFDMKLQQLTLLEHKHIVIFWHEWLELENQLDRQNFLKRKLANIINI